MEVEFLHQFSKDLDKISLKTVKQNLLNIISALEDANAFSEIANTKKLKGHKSAYRIRIGDYRIGVFVEGQKVTFARIIHRKDIYKVFP
jgi:mRNA interferase RelE/StbE